MRLVLGTRVAAMTGTAVNRSPPPPVKTDGRREAIVSKSGDPRPLPETVPMAKNGPMRPRYAGIVQCFPSVPSWMAKLLVYWIEISQRPVARVIDAVPERPGSSAGPGTVTGVVMMLA